MDPEVSLPTHGPQNPGIGFTCVAILQGVWLNKDSCVVSRLLASPLQCYYLFFCGSIFFVFLPIFRGLDLLFEMLYHDGIRLLSLHKCYIISLSILQLCAITIMISNILLFLPLSKYFRIIQLSLTHPVLLVTAERNWILSTEIVSFWSWYSSSHGSKMAHSTLVY